MKELSDEQYAATVEALQENIVLRKRIAELENDLVDVKDLIMKFLQVIGFGDGKQVYPQLLLPEDHPDHKSPTIALTKALGDFGQLILASKFSKQAEKKLEDKFSFISKYTPLILKYGDGK